MSRFVLPALLGATLLFLVQPLIAKALLPWFGGSAAVWTTCQLFFQVLLLAGYAWTHGLVARLSPARQRVVQLTLMGVALVALLATTAWWSAPLIPSASLRPDGQTAPIPRLLLALFLSVGLPYLALATTGPLVQAWAARLAPGEPVYRLYAASNVGSLAGLLVYPLALEPLLRLPVQGWWWLVGFVGWVVSLAWASRGLSGERAEPIEASAGGVHWLRWLSLSAAPVVLLLAVTNHLTQEVAPIPFLWVLPLAAYLASFVITFESARWYRRGWAVPVLAVMSLLVAGQGITDVEVPLPARVLLFLVYLLVAFITAHGELAASRPPAAKLTTFYAALALGGAVGGVLVGLVAPFVFNQFYELELGFVALLLVLVRAVPKQRVLQVALVLTLAAAVTSMVRKQRGVVAAQRDFFGVVRVVEVGDETDGATLMMHGRTVHGAQRNDAPREGTTYYAKESGVGRLLLRDGEPRRVGVIGLGTGTVAVYGRAGDVYRFYEISPAVMDFAQGAHFSFLRDSAATVEVVPGDARTSLEREPPQQFDVLILDAFSSDSVPVHLVTEEALRLYASHLAPGGVVAMHLSNRSLELVPVAARLGRAVGFTPRELVAPGVSDWALMSRWLLLTRAVWPGLGEPEPRVVTETDAPLWTDDFSSLWPVVRW